MSLSASSAVIMIPGVGKAEVHEKHPAAPSLQSLLYAHAVATQVASELWDRVANIEEFVFAPASVPVRVRYSWLVGEPISGKTGQRERTPLYAYDAEQIEKVCRSERDTNLLMLSKSDHKARQHVHQICKVRIAALIGELTTLQGAMDRLADECGLTAAEEVAGAASERRDELADAISYHVPATLYEAALLAEWVSRSPLYDDGDLPFSVLANIARAGGQASGPPTLEEVH